MPRRVLRRGAVQQGLIGLLILGPQLPLVDVGRVVLPVLVGPVQPFGEPLLLLVERDEHRDLDDRRAVVDQFLLERVDLVVPRAPHLGRHQVVHPHDEHVLVVRPVEHADVTCGGQRVPDPPQVVVGQLLLSRLAEARVSNALRIARSDNVFDDAALACGVHALQYQQHLAGVAGPAVRVQHLLQFGEALVAFGLQVGRIRLGPAEARCGVRLDVGDQLARLELEVGVRFVGPERREVVRMTCSPGQSSRCGGRIGDGCGIELNFSRDPPTSTIPRSALHDSIVR